MWWIGELAKAAVRPGVVVGAGRHQTSSVRPLTGAHVVSPQDNGGFEKQLMVSANGNTPIIFLSDAAGPRCIRNGLKSGEAAPSHRTSGAASGSLLLPGA